MPRQCRIENCKPQWDSPDGLKLNYFQVPKYPSRRQEWEKSVNDHFNSRRLFDDYSYICFLYFREECFNRLNERVTLKKTAIPTIFYNFQDEIEVYKSNEKSLDILDPSVLMKLTEVGNTFDTSEDKHCRGMNVDSESSLDSSQIIINSDENSVRCLEEQPTCYKKINSKDETVNSLPQSSTEKLFHKSIVNLDIDTINLDNKFFILKVLTSAKIEIERLRRINRAKSS
ncbi:THAP domain-containing protein 3-like [Phymastichus coffea]|uniref:THAP domain-containing protein 3-like n=1 Tax=Phymastichus coffea TaxID=108790 RepID=UPI00273B5614|nr:THAP domain-containing protein 3-like [Phymastichus coffea]